MGWPHPTIEERPVVKILLTVEDQIIAPRFDLAGEVVIVEQNRSMPDAEPRTILLSRKNGEELSDLIIKEGVDCLICGGIEERFYTFFVWKKIQVLDGVIGAWTLALERAEAGTLVPGAILAGSGRGDNDKVSG
jgi:predicted Fe-Mo cluster-binding NifX family protein